MPSAGEVEQYAYCAHNWWLAREGVGGEGAGSERGVGAHHAKGEDQARIERDKREYRYSLQASISIIMLAMAGVLAAIALNLRGEVDVTALTVVAIVLGLGSSGLLTLALFARRDYLRARTASGIVPGRLIATDLAGTAPLLNDPEWGLTGRPDYILQTKDGQVPVEVKTGHTPKHAYRSHRLQVACYLRLLESTGKKPEYGMVSYPDGVFRVAWDDALRQDLRTTLDRMQAAKKEGRADRDHDQAARCRGCARREACTQKLGP